jgi:DUF1680 family protein
VVLEGKAPAETPEKWNGQLYREIQTPAPKTINLRLIPYFAWDNRGASGMTVWIPRGSF